jgi:hypothetical protein
MPDSPSPPGTAGIKNTQSDSIFDIESHQPRADNPTAYAPSSVIASRLF